jgi:hypothetical protein
MAIGAVHGPAVLDALARTNFPLIRALATGTQICRTNNLAVDVNATLASRCPLNEAEARTLELESDDAWPFAGDCDGIWINRDVAARGRRDGYGHLLRINAEACGSKEQQRCNCYTMFHLFPPLTVDS